MTEEQWRDKIIADRENTYSVEVNDCMHYELHIDLMRQRLSHIRHPFGQVYRCAKGGHVRYVKAPDGKTLMFNKLEWLHKKNPYTKLTYPHGGLLGRILRKLI